MPDGSCWLLVATSSVATPTLFSLEEQLELCDFVSLATDFERERIRLALPLVTESSSFLVRARRSRRLTRTVELATLWATSKGLTFVPSTLK